MTHAPIRLSFKIDAFTPTTLPMARLAEYMADLAKMLGERDSVHFVELKEGSAQIIHEVAHTAYPKIRERARAIAADDAPADAMAAYRALNARLAADNASGVYAPVAGGADILPFPGVRAPKPTALRPVDQQGSIDGIVIGVGGRSVGHTKAPVIVDTGEAVIACEASRIIAKELGHHVFDAARRFHGVGTWERSESGGWVLKKFRILTHEELDVTPLTEIVRRLRAVPSELSLLSDPLTAILSDRAEGELN